VNPSPDSFPVQPDEYVFRRIPLVYFNPHNPIPIKLEAFRPTDRDSTGISVFRERFVTTEQIMAGIDPAKRQGIILVRLPVSEIVNLGLTVVPDPDLPGHSLIPKLNSADYTARKIHWKEIQYRLAVIASEELSRRRATENPS
jgi:hypothetical protein